MLIAGATTETVLTLRSKTTRMMTKLSPVETAMGAVPEVAPNHGAVEQLLPATNCWNWRIIWDIISI